MEKQELAQAVYQRLIAFFGEPQWTPPANPSAEVIDELIHTILSANTNDVNSGRAFDQLRAHFGPDWDAVRTAPLEEIKVTIRPAGMYNQKAPNIVATLEMIKRDYPDYDLSGLAAMSVADALRYLTALPGVGHKTASIVLLFCFNRAAFPVDTHIQRISQRLGIGSRRSSPAQLKVLWEQLLPPETYYPLHLNLIRHGRTICDARQPKCDLCPLQSDCDYYNRQGEWR